MGMPKTLLEAVRHFSNADNCREYLVARRWPNGIACPKCGSTAVYFDKGRNGWECKTRHPQRKFTLKTGTIFEDSPIGFDKWLPVVWMIANSKNGVSSHEIARTIGVTQKTAWFMLQRIRLAMQGDDGGKMGGDVEVDETYIGGKARNMHASKRAKMATGRWAGKVAVMGLLERKGDKDSRVRTVVVQGAKRSDLLPHVDANVARGANVYTDALHSYDALRHDYAHQVIDHAVAYVDGQVHTNGLESYWAILKRALRGTYISVEPFHLFRYLDEQAFRFKERKLNDAERFELVVGGVVGRRLTYEALIGALNSGNAPE